MSDEKREILISRIQRMEQIYDEVLEMKDLYPDSFLADQGLKEKLQELLDYYENGQWLKDYESDERGEVPEDLKRGVLSQDALYDLFSEVLWSE